MPEEILEKKPSAKEEVDSSSLLPEVIKEKDKSDLVSGEVVVQEEVLKEGDLELEVGVDGIGQSEVRPLEIDLSGKSNDVLPTGDGVVGDEFEVVGRISDLEKTADDLPPKKSFKDKFLNILDRGKDLGKNFLQNSATIAGDLGRRSAKAIRDKTSDVAESLKPKLEKAINGARDFTDEAVAVIGGMAKVGASKLGDKTVELGGFLKDSGIIIKGEITSRLESAVALAADTLGKISNSDIVQGAVDRISIFKNTMAEAWVGSGVDEFNAFIKQQETGLADIEKSLSSRRSDLANLEQISKDVGFDVSEAAREKLQKDIEKKEADLKSEKDRIDTMKAENSFYEVRRTGYLAKIESSKKNIADRIQAKIDINSEHSEDLQDRLDELSANKRKNSGELEKLTTHFRDLDRLTRETDSEGARRSAVSLMRQIGPRINELEAELIACNKDEGKILKRKAKIDQKIAKNEENLDDINYEIKETLDKADGVESKRFSERGFFKRWNEAMKDYPIKWEEMHWFYGPDLGASIPISRRMMKDDKHKSRFIQMLVKSGIDPKRQDLNKIFKEGLDAIYGTSNGVGGNSKSEKAIDSNSETVEEKPVYFEDYLLEESAVKEAAHETQEVKGQEKRLSLDEFLAAWNQDFPELSLVKGNFATVSKMRRDKSNMRHVILNLVHAQHPGSNPKIVKMCIDAIYKNK